MEKEKVLIVDDDQMMLNLLKYSLSGDYDVTVSLGPREALEEIRSNSFSIAILDINMPELNGLSLLKMIKGTRPGTEVIIMTGFPGLDSSVEALRGGAFDYLQKPFTPDALKYTIEKAILRRKLKEHSATLEDITGVLAALIEKKDPYTAFHQKRVSHLAVAIARRIGLAEKNIIELQNACLIHDLGKIYITPDILNKPGKLEQEEMELIKLHPQAGFDVLVSVEQANEIACMVLHHHEAIDGSGYPNGLTGKMIMKEAKIITVADSVDAMISDRPYRQGLSMNKVMEELKRHSGKLYDPSAVDACLELFSTGFKMGIK